MEPLGSCSIRRMYGCMGPISTLLAAFTAVKAAQLLIIALTPLQFDTSSALLLLHYAHEPEKLLKAFVPLLNRLVAWDAVYFADMFKNGITFEHQYVFCPLWWRFIHSLPLETFHLRLLAATLIGNAAHLAAALVLYLYTLRIFTAARFFPARSMALSTLVLFVLLPAGIFLTAPYSEAPCALFSFLCLYFREIGVGSAVSRPNAVVYVLSGFFAAIAFGLRANALLLGLVYVYDLARAPLLRPIIAGLVLGLAFLYSHVANYLAVCGEDRGEWCNYTFPILYTYCQKHYWGNGLFKYWTLGNVPNFAFAAPVTLLLVLGTRFWWHDYPIERIAPVLIVNGAFLFLLITTWHVQIITRVHTFVPVVYWFGAGLLHRPTVLAKATVAYFVFWNAVQCALYGAFLPPA